MSLFRLQYLLLNWLLMVHPPLHILWNWVWAQMPTLSKHSKQSREDIHWGVSKSSARVPPSVYIWSSFSTDRATLHLMLADGQDVHPTPHPPSLHSRVVTQHGSWLVMEPVSHPASTNLNPHPSVQLEPPLRLTKWPRESVRGVGWRGEGVWLWWAGSQIRTIFHPHFTVAILSSRNTHRCTGVVCKHIQMHEHTHGSSHMVWSHCWYFSHDKYVGLHGFRNRSSSIASSRGREVFSRNYTTSWHHLTNKYNALLHIHVLITTFAHEEI